MAGILQRVGRTLLGAQVQEVIEMNEAYGKVLDDFGRPDLRSQKNRCLLLVSEIAQG